MKPSREKLVAALIIAVIAVAGVGAVVLLSGNGSPPKVHVYIDQQGSETMYELCQEWGKQYSAKDRSVTINVSRGGSGPGIAALLAGGVDIAQASRPMKDSERAQAAESGLEIIELKVALDGIAIVVNPDNDVDALTIEQLRGIYNGTYTNWNEVGGADTAILAYGRNNTSGTYAYFQEHVLDNGAYAANMSEYPDYNQMIADILAHPGAVGYVGIGFAANYPDVKVVALQEDASSEAYYPTEANVLSGKYELSRYLYFYLTERPKGAMLDYLAWLVDPAGGQAVAESMGFYAVPPAAADENKAKLGL